MEIILLASIVWVVFLLSNIMVGIAMYKLGLHGKILKWSEKLSGNEDEIIKKVSTSLDSYIPGSEYDPFKTQPESRYKYFSMEDEEEDFVDDPVVPKGGEVENAGER